MAQKKIRLNDNQVLLSLDKEYFRDYLVRGLNFAVENDSLVINLSEPIGQIIYSNSIPTETAPSQRAYSDFTIKVTLPETRYDTFERKFININRSATKRINEGIKAYFNLHFEQYVLSNRKNEQIIKNRIYKFYKEKLGSTEAISEDALIKKYFRRRKYLQEQFEKSLQNAS